MNPLSHHAGATRAAWSDLAVLVLFGSCLASCGYMVGTPYPKVSGQTVPLSLASVPGGPTCEFSVRSPSGSGWMMPPGNRGPESVELTFYRYADKVLLKRAESVRVYSLPDSSLLSPEKVDGAWLRVALGRTYSWNEIHGLDLAVLSASRLDRGEREYFVVDYTASYHLQRNAGDSFDHGRLYITRSPCPSWPGLLVFGLTDSHYGGSGASEFPRPEAEQAVTSVMESLACRE